MVVIIFLLSSILYEGRPQELKITKFRESFASFRVTKGADVTWDCANIHLKLVTSFNTPEAPLNIKMACDADFARADLNFEDYYDETDDIFKEVLKMTATISSETNGAGTKYIEIQDNDIRVRPGTVKKLTLTGSDQTKIDVDVIYRCQGYDGYNCNFEDIANPNYKRDPATKKAYCVSEDKSQCGDQKCPDDNKLDCSGNGECYVETFGEQNQYCACNPGFYGDDCENPVPKTELAEEILLFAPETELPEPSDEQPEDVTAPVGDCDTNCEKCQFVEKFKVCMVSKAGYKYGCEGTDCDETCGVAYCRLQIGETISYYAKALTSGKSATLVNARGH